MGTAEWGVDGAQGHWEVRARCEWGPKRRVWFKAEGPLGWASEDAGILIVSWAPRGGGERVMASEGVGQVGSTGS